MVDDINTTKSLVSRIGDLLDLVNNTNPQASTIAQAREMLITCELQLNRLAKRVARLQDSYEETLEELRRTDFDLNSTVVEVINYLGIRCESVGDRIRLEHHLTEYKNE